MDILQDDTRQIIIRTFDPDQRECGDRQRIFPVFRSGISNKWNGVPRTNLTGKGEPDLFLRCGKPHGGICYRIVRIYGIKPAGIWFIKEQGILVENKVFQQIMQENYICMVSIILLTKMTMGNIVFSLIMIY